MAKPLNEKRPPSDYADRLALCRANCRRSKNTSPFAGCKCRCGGYAHGSETLADMKAADRRKAQQAMRDDLRRGAAWVEARELLAQVQREAERVKARLKARGL